MILQALIGYAQRENLGDPDFEFVGVRWLVSLTSQGMLAGDPIPLSENSEEKKPRPKQLWRPFTSPNELNQGTKSHFLCDTLERAILLLDPKAADKAEARRVQHLYFQNLLAEAASAVPTEKGQISAVLSLLGDQARMGLLRDKFTAAKAKPSDNVTFSVEGRLLLNSEALRQFWRDRRKNQESTATTRELRVCVASGEMSQTLDTTEKIRGVPGGLAMGTNLISFDKEAFCSFGLEQAQNAALSPAAELKMRSALNALIEKSRSQGLVFNETVHLHWSREPLATEDPMDLLAKADSEAVASLLKSVQSGDRYIGLDANAYYALSLSGNGARIVVRDWLESTVPEVQENIADWFNDLALVLPDGSGVKRDFKFGALLYGMVRADLSELSPQIPTQLLHAALRGRTTPLPQSALAAALRRQQIDQDNKLDPPRLALIKACLLRLPNVSKNLNSTNETMSECLNPEYHDAAYLCGRLFAVFDRLQFLALGGVNAGVVERYYASASVTPSLVMGRLFRNAQFHLAKAGGGMAENVRKDFEEITCALGDRFPSTLNLESQGRFALGYYHQKAEYRRRTAERKEQQAIETAST
ncbi:MAG: type I-C CRISPR-associated protein Cas8c/Csd1 [Verrucomicrobiales bacterium]|nr:type I-C CRISPR-associated protein Cas8c/Csd1 [Verrucomicrobiales bacterium]